MNYELLFLLANAYVMPFWLILFFLPQHRWAKVLNGSLWQFMPLAVVYAVLLVPAFTTVIPAVARPELSTITSLLANDFGITVVWIHILVWDLFVGRWMWQDALMRNVANWKLRICLLFTLMSGPIGLLLYLALSKKSLTQTER